jgi:hypothetical protein
MRSVLILAFCLLTAAGPALAHSMVERSTPANGQTYAAAPKTFEISFQHAVILASISLETAFGEPISVPYAPSKSMDTTFAVPLPALDPGDYTLSWRALAKDGHVMSESIAFTVDG